MKTNNQAESYGLFLRISVDKKKGIMDMYILGDSLLIIKNMNYNSTDQNNKLNQIIKRN